VLPIRIGRGFAIEYVVALLGFWGFNIASRVADSSHLECDPSGCPTSPRHLWLLLVGLGFAAILCVLAFRLTTANREQWDPVAPVRPPLAVVVRFALWWLAYWVALTLSVALPSAVRALHRSE
jgi:hypothetical protein